MVSRAAYRGTLLLDRRIRAVAFAGVLLLTLGAATPMWAAPGSRLEVTGGVRHAGAVNPKTLRLTQVLDVPFEAVQVVTRRTGREARETRGRMARNAEGSTYVELAEEDGSVARILILDVPQRREIVLNVRCRCYRVRTAPELAARSLTAGWMLEQLGQAAAQKDASRHEVVNGSDTTVTTLGTRRVSGLEAIGTREVRPATGAGAEREMESWFSVDLGLAVLMRERGVGRGEETEVLLTEILRSEPDPALFRIPEGYVPEARRAISRVPATGL